ncbi:DNA-3-methyladenine glycosylase II [Sporobolomyces salmoneus]|uniref:DNA-3-methyladenine glycosylase II n=1 Tax=Sporobolomyces salmoneus TaxID=183962 RepID=UPI003170C284
MASRITRSSSRAATSTNMLPPSSPASKRSPPPPPQTPPPKRARKTAAAPPDSPYVPPTPRTEQAIVDSVKEQQEKGEKEGTVLMHPELKFKYEDAKRHLISSDKRWERVMNQLECKPFEGEQNDPFNPFKSLVSSILGQQVSWMAARSIQHKFCRIWAPHLPEKLPPPDSGIPRVEDPFPTPQQVLSTPDRRETLRNAGLSYRKVEYVVELAERFADGRLDAKKLWEMDDEEIEKTLVEVRGIGVWTVHMFCIFSMKRPDVCPVGDLGIQKNLCRWYSQDPTFVPSIHPRKLVGSPKKKSTGPVKKEKDSLIEGIGKLDELGASSVEREKVIDLSASAEEPAEDVKEEEEESLDNDDFVFPETSNGLTPQILKNRLAGKKIKGAYLTPTEMEELMKPWEPYRSIACWYLWSVTDKE